MTWWIMVLQGTLCAWVGMFIGYKVGKRGSDARETALRTDRDFWHLSAEEWRKENAKVREKFAIADGAYMACRLELDRLQSVRSEAGRKAAATRKLRALAEGTDTNTNGASE